MEQVLGEVRICMGEGAPHVVVFTASGLHQLLELGHYAVIASFAGIVHPKGIMYLLASVQGQDHIAHLPVGKVYYLVVNEHAVGGEGKAEFLVVGLLLGAGIGNQLLYHLPVHQRLSAEEVHLQIGAAAGVFNEEVQGPLANFKAHQGPFPVILALAGKAVGTVEVAGVGHMEAQSLHHVPGTLLEVAGHGGKIVGSVELARFLQSSHIGNTGIELLLRHVLPPGILHQQLPDNVLRALFLIHGYYVVGHLVHRVDGTGAAVQYNIVPV